MKYTIDYSKSRGELPINHAVHEFMPTIFNGLFAKYDFENV